MTAEAVVEVRAAYPLHARPAARVVQLAATYAAEITLERLTDDGPQVASATSILSLLGLTLGTGDLVVIRALGADARPAADALAALLANVPIQSAPAGA